MKFIKPNFYDKFRCIASACSDTCCAGWEIDIDPDTRRFYESVQGEFGERLREQIDEMPEGVSCFRLGEGDRCPFLTDDNLCEIIIELGEKALCEICREHPRFYEQVGDRMEMGLGLCCEEACRLLFEEKEPITFITTSIGDMPDVIILPETGMEIYRLRDEAFRLVQDRSLPLRCVCIVFWSSAGGFKSSLRVRLLLRIFRRMKRSPWLVRHCCSIWKRLSRLMRAGRKTYSCLPMQI